MTTADFTWGFSCHSIDSSVYKKGLSSLRIGSGTDYGRWDKAGTTNVTEGMIRVWLHWNDIENSVGVQFGSTTVNAGYRVIVTRASSTTAIVTIYRNNNPVSASAALPLLANTWYEIYIAWWLSGSDLVVKVMYSADGISYTSCMANYTDSSPVSGTYVWVYGAANGAGGNVYLDELRLYKKV